MDDTEVGVLPPLNVSFKTTSGITREVVERYGLCVEVASADTGTKAVVADLTYAVHMPFNEAPLGRLNYAATDEDFRNRSLERIKECLRAAGSDFPDAQVAVIHGSPARWTIHEHAGARVGDYDLFIQGLRELADCAADSRVLLVLENNNWYWYNDSFEYTWINSEPHPDLRYFAATPADWIRAWEDAAHDNLKLCLDTAHACTYSHTVSDHDKRAETLLSYFDRPEAIGHVHWNGHLAFEPEGRIDGHLTVGDGTIPVEVHGRIKQLGVRPTLEHYHGEEALERELEFIRRL
ncbi:MAG: TIM barrel protein [Armatimonadota bacterium]